MNIHPSALIHSFFCSVSSVFFFNSTALTLSSFPLCLVSAVIAYKSQPILLPVSLKFWILKWNLMLFIEQSEALTSVFFSNAWQWSDWTDWRSVQGVPRLSLCRTRKWRRLLDEKWNIFSKTLKESSCCLFSLFHDWMIENLQTWWDQVSQKRLFRRPVLSWY